MKFWQSSHTFDHPWSTVSQAFWRKYPNEFQSIVVGTDVIERRVTSDGKLHSTRIITSDWGVPGWMRLFIPASKGYSIEHSIVDPINKTLTLRSKNLSISSIMSFHESVVYRAASDKSTELYHGVEVSCSASRMLDNLAETWIVDTVGEKATLGLQAMDSIIKKVESEAICAMKAVDDFANETFKSVDDLTNDAMKSIDNFSVSDTMKSIDDFTTDAKKSIDDFTTDAKKSIDGLTNDAIKSMDLLKRDSSNLESVRTRS